MFLHKYLFICSNITNAIKYHLENRLIKLVRVKMKVFDKCKYFLYYINTAYDFGV